MVANIDEVQRLLNSYYDEHASYGTQIEIKDLVPLVGGVENRMYTFNQIHHKGTKTTIQPSVLRLYKWPDAAEFEYKVMEKLRQANIPVPKIFILERDTKYLGSTFVIMEKVKGDSLGNVIASRTASDPSWLNSPEAMSLCTQFAGVLASLHRLDWQKAGLDFLKTSAEYSVESIIASFGTPADLEIAARFEEIKKLYAWIIANALKSTNAEKVILHLDYHPNNIMFHEDKLEAILDWPNTCLGEAELDVGYTTCVLYMQGTEKMISPFLKEYKRCSGRELGNLALYVVIAGLRIIRLLLSIMSEGGRNSELLSDAHVNADINKNLIKAFILIYHKTGINMNNIIKLLNGTGKQPIK